MSVVSDLIASTTVAQWKQRIIDLAQAVGLAVTSWLVPGLPSEQWLQIMAALFKVMADTVTDSNRAHFLSEATDPGDGDGLEPAAGWLSKKGEGDYGTPRTQSTFANGFERLTNTGNTTHTIRPEQLTFKNSTTGKTYRNEDDEDLYPPPAKVLTLAPSDVVLVPIRAEEVGTASNASGGQIDTLSTSLLGVVVTNPGPVLGTDREERTKYVRRCRLAASATSPNGPAAAYQYLIERTNTDGTISVEEDGKTVVNVTRINVTREDSYGIVRVYLASPSGPASSDDVTAVETVLDNSYAPDCVTRIVEAAEAVPFPITSTVTVDAAPGLTTGIIQAAILERLTAFFSGAQDGDIQIGGYDGTLTVARIRAEIVKAHPRIYNVSLTSPLLNAAIADNELPTLSTVTTTVVFT